MTISDMVEAAHTLVEIAPGLLTLAVITVGALTLCGRILFAR
jgi:hypothetical protein